MSVGKSIMKNIKILLQKFLSKSSDVVNINSKPKKAHLSQNIHYINVLCLKNSFNSHFNSFFYVFLHFHVFLRTVQLILINLRAL
jgi:hypothetical protein